MKKPACWTLVSGTVNPELAAIARFAIETAMRQGEIIGMTWGMIDLRRRVVRLPDTKNGLARDVPLLSTVREVDGMGCADDHVA